MERRFLFLVAAGLLTFVEQTSRADTAKNVSFDRDVRPILSRYCFACHGPDDSSREANLRLDDRGSALEAAASGEPAIIPGKPADSELVKRILSDDDDVKMPPKATNHVLTAAQKTILQDWIAAGADYTPHWAFVAPKQAPLPDVRDAAWPKNPIDRFILARLDKEGMAPSPSADRYTLVRRVYLDLIGLPPTPEQAEAFVKDAAPDAYGKLVDALLASPHYGERWARRWLDLARYADTNGYEKDRPRSVWPYRDWVVSSLNADMPFDRFTIEQLAGDLLPAPTIDQRIATGFHRNTMLNEEGGIDPLEFRFYAMTDRVATTGTTWLGLTTGCAQCHTHKYDPISHREYYQLMAFLNNADELEIDLPDADVAKRQTETQAKLAAAIAALADQFPPYLAAQPPIDGKANANQRFAEWIARKQSRTVEWTPIVPQSMKSNLPHLALQPDGSIFVSGDTTKSDTYELTFAAPAAGVQAVRLEALPDDRLPAKGPGTTYYEGRKGDFFLGEFQLRADGKPLKIADSSESYAKNGFGKEASAALAADGDPQTGWTCSGRYGERHVAVFQLAEPSPKAAELHVTMQFGRHFASSLGRFRISVTNSSNAKARDLPAATEAILAKAEKNWTDEERETLRRQFLLVAPELTEARKKIEALRQSLPTFPSTLVFAERPTDNPRPTRIQHRGEYLQPKETVTADVLAVLPPLPPSVPKNRLSFAEWIVAPENPLVARVAVNRQWAAFFGRGIVKTTEDFGVQSDPPAHPELLDWLAVEFMRQGWSMKKLHRLIVASATYQQSSNVSPEILKTDRENILLARAPRVRLEAELVRDAVLHSSGVLSLKMGGPPVYPPQPEGVTEAAYGKPKWNVSQGEDRHRRSLYTFAKRTAPFAMFNAFDAPSGEACIARRDVSNTPLQALTLLNDSMFLEAAQSLGAVLVQHPGNVEERARYAFQRVCTRPPTAEETAMLTAYFAKQKRRFEAKELDAEKLAGKKADNVNDLAAWTMLARALFNLDEMVTKG